MRYAKIKVYEIVDGTPIQGVEIYCDSTETKPTEGFPLLHQCYKHEVAEQSEEG